MNGSEAIFGFMGWLTTRDNELTVSRKHECSEVVNLIEKFCTENNLEEPREGWENMLKFPVETCTPK